MRRIFYLPIFAVFFLFYSGFGQKQKNSFPDMAPDTYLQDGTPVKRCGTMEYEQWRRQQHPELGTLDDFENWMQEKLKEFKRNLQNGKVQAVSYRIPVIVHVIHDGEAVGTGLNISQSQIQSQIDRLNEDFQKLNADTVNIPGVFAPLAADCQIEFCLAQFDPAGNPLPEPGIDRIDRNAKGWSAPPYTTTYIDGTIKPGSIWDPGQYLNMWVTDISGGILGYATFPPSSGLTGIPGSTGTNSTDGVVIGYRFFGDITKDPGANLSAPYNLGRTATHEVGHWLGLRHIWGDATCGDDFCNDTPTADQPHYSCQVHPLHVDVCGGGSSPNGEMFMNYMDYVDDDCMHMFTYDQRARMWTALMNSPLRTGFASSVLTLCPSPDPLITFTAPSSSQEESSASGTVDCRGYIDVNIPVRVTADPFADVTVNLDILGGTARLGIDYDVIVGTLDFFAGDGAVTKNFVIRVYDEASMENDETIDLSFTISDTTAANYGTQITHTFTIVDNDPELYTEVPLFYEDFETGGTGWTFNAQFSTAPNPNGSNQWVVGTANPLYGSQSAYISRDGGASNSYDIGSASEYLLISPQIDATAQSTVYLSFHYLCNGEISGGTVYDFGSLYYSTNGTNYTLIDGGANTTSPFLGVTTDTRYFKDISALVAGSTFYLAWYWENDGSVGSNPPFNIDSIYVWAPGTAVPVETALNASQTEYLGPGDSAYFISGNNNVMVKIINKDNAHDYGCITTQIDRAGTGGIDFQVVGAPATEKTFLVTPTNNNAAGSYDIVLYYTEAEIAGWEAVSGRTRNTLQVFKTSGAVSNVTPTNPLANGNTNVYAGTSSPFAYYLAPDWGWRGDFTTGFSGFALCDGCISISPAPLLSFSAKLVEGKNAQLSWTFAGDAPEIFDIERSFNGKDFQSIGFVLPKQGKNASASYEFLDKNLPQYDKEIVYYRLKAKYSDGSKEYSNVEILRIPFILSNSIALFPNPATQSFTLRFGNMQDAFVIAEIYNMMGQKVTAREFRISSDKLHDEIFDIASLTSGQYIVRVITKDTVKQFKLIKR